MFLLQLHVNCAQYIKFERRVFKGNDKKFINLIVKCLHFHYS